MSSKIGIISDVHATVEPVREALSIFKKRGIKTVFCLGDIAGYGEELSETVRLLEEAQCQSILGNHEVWYLEKSENENDSNAQYFKTLPRTIELTTEGKKLYFVHASPPDDDMNGIRLLDEKGDLLPGEKEKWLEQLNESHFDVLLVGHTHQVFHEKIGNKIVINPGSTKFNHTAMILSLPEMETELVSLSNQKPILSWNWSMVYKEKRTGNDEGNKTGNRGID